MPYVFNVFTSKLDLIGSSSSGFITSLTTTGTSGAATVTSGVLNVPQYSGGGSGITRSIAIVTTTITGSAVVAIDYVYLLSTGAIYTQPTAVSNTNRYAIKNITSTNITVSSTSSQTFDGSTTMILTPNTSVDLISDNTNWRTI